MAAQSPSSATRDRAGFQNSAAGLLLGAGVAYLLSVPLVLLLSGAGMLGSTKWPYAVYWFIAIAINAPHYGATILRV